LRGSGWSYFRLLGLVIPTVPRIDWPLSVCSFEARKIISSPKRPRASSNLPPNCLKKSSFLMSSTSMLRIAARAQPSTFFRANGLRSLTPRSSNALYAVPALIATSGSVSSFSTSSRRLSDKDGEEGSHHEESFEEFTARYAVPNWCRRRVESF